MKKKNIGQPKRLSDGKFKCENPGCNKEHDGSYGSGRFCSDHCRRAFCRKQVKHCGGGTIKGKSQDHSKSRAPYGTWKCSDCGFVGNTRRDLEQHRRSLHGAHKCWNKGLTKETDQRVAANAKSVKSALKKLFASGYDNPNQPSCKSYWTEVRCQEQSVQKINLYAEHPEKHPNRILAHNREKMTYPEKLTYDFLIEHEIKFEHQYFFNADGLRRYVDFYIPCKKLFIEIDGEYWHDDGNDKDAKKDKIAEKHNIRTLRIRYPSMHVIDILTKEFC